MRKREIVILIINIILTIVLIVSVICFCGFYLHPSKYLGKSRDKQRLSDLANIKTALDLYVADGGNFDWLETGKIYTSLNSSVAIDGQGWLPINFKTVLSGVPLDVLPVDPLNDGLYSYRVGVNVREQTYEIDCRLEKPSGLAKAENDGGDSADWYEVGTDLTILK